MTIIGRLAIGAALASLSFSALAAETLSAAQLQQRLAAGNSPLIIDVRSEQDYLAGRLPGARLISLPSLASYTASLAGAQHESILVYCGDDACAKQAADTLEQAGFSKVLLLEGNYAAWDALQK